MLCLACLEEETELVDDIVEISKKSQSKRKRKEKSLSKIKIKKKFKIKSESQDLSVVKILFLKYIIIILIILILFIKKENLTLITSLQNKYFYSEILSDVFFHFSEHRKLLNTTNADNKNKQEKLDTSADQTYRNKKF